MSTHSFDTMLAEDGKKNSLGRVNDVVAVVVHDRSTLDELYALIFHTDAWVRMRAIDAFEKVCRIHPDWGKQYVDDIQVKLAASTQASIRWHVAQLYGEIELNDEQKTFAVEWLTTTLRTANVDWIVAVNAMNTLASFVRSGDVKAAVLLPLLTTQQGHTSKAVVKRACALSAEFS